MRVAIINYGMGNLTSVSNAVAALGATPTLASDRCGLEAADRLILPGVGAFGEAMDRLRSLGLIEPLAGHVLGTRKPILGICLGMQLLASSSLEHGQHAGLGWIEGEVRPIPSADGLRIPHVGWNAVRIVHQSPLVANLSGEPTFYFVHSYHFVPVDRGVVLGETDYGQPLAAIVGKDNIFGTQFHPEKSQGAGLALLKSFLALEQAS